MLMITYNRAVKSDNRDLAFNYIFVSEAEKETFIDKVKNGVGVVFNKQYNEHESFKSVRVIKEFKFRSPSDALLKCGYKKIRCFKS